MSTVLQVDGDADTIVEIIEQDAGITCAQVDDIAFSINRLNLEHGVLAGIETTDEEVVLTIRFPRH